MTLSVLMVERRRNCRAGLVLVMYLEHVSHHLTPRHKGSRRTCAQPQLPAVSPPRPSGPGTQGEHAATQTVVPDRARAAPRDAESSTSKIRQSFWWPDVLVRARFSAGQRHANSSSLVRGGGTELRTRPAAGTPGQDHGMDAWVCPGGQASFYLILIS